MIVLDTNVISEALKAAPEPRVVTWLDSLTGEVAITAVTLAELMAGLQRLPEGRHETALGQSIEMALEPFRGTRSILAFDEVAALAYGRVLTARQGAGLPISTADAQIAAICLARGATLATRNVRDFTSTGVLVTDPWEQGT